MTRTNRRRIVCLACVATASSVGAALAGPFPEYTIRQMIEMSISRLVQVDRQINSVNSLLEEENRRQAWLADVAQQERWTAEQYGHELGLSCQRIAELSAELAGHYAHAASLKTHLANLYAELGEEVPEAFRKPQPKPAERIGDTGTGVDQAPDRSEPIPSPGDTAH